MADLTGNNGVLKMGTTIVPLNDVKEWGAGTLDATYSYKQFRAVVSDYGTIYLLVRNDNPHFNGFERYLSMSYTSDINLTTTIESLSSGDPYRLFFVLKDAVTT